MAFYEAASQMASAMSQAGIKPLEDVTDKLASEAGKFIRFRCEGDRRGRKNGYAVLFPDGQGGAFGHWPSQLKGSWQSSVTQAFRSSRDMREISRRLAAQADTRLDGERSAAEGAEELLMVAEAADPLHPYLIKKGIPSTGLYQRREILLAPMTDIFGKVWNLQRILPDGSKLFMPGNRRPRTFWSVGLNLGDDIASHPDCIYIGEGVATMLAVHVSSGSYPVVAAMDANSLEPCARAIRIRFPKSTLFICADDDADTEARIGRNPGMEAANAAAAAVGGLVIKPVRRSM